MERERELNESMEIGQRKGKETDQRRKESEREGDKSEEKGKEIN